MPYSTRSNSLWQSLLSYICLDCTSSDSYTLIEEEEESLVTTEEMRYRDVPLPSNPRTPNPPILEQPITSISPPVSFDQPQSPPLVDISMKRLHRRGLINTTNFHAEEVTVSESRASRSPREMGAITETELTDNMNLVDTASMIGSVGSIIGTGYAGTTYYQQKRAEKEARRREQDLEAAIERVGERVQGARTDSSISVVKETEQMVGHTPVKVLEPESIGRKDLAWTGMR